MANHMGEVAPSAGRGQRCALWVAVYVALLAVLTFMCFWRLGDGTVWNSDESRHAVNAYEIMRSGNPVASTYGYDDDYWNLKPPLSHWVIILGYTLFGANGWGLRFFSALSYVAMIVLTSQFLRKRVGWGAAVLNVAFAFSCVRMIGFHMVRSGDADGVYELLAALSLLAIYWSRKRHWWIYVSGLLIGLGFLTKSWHTLWVFPTILIYLIVTGQLRKFRPLEVVGFFASVLVPIVAWGVARYAYDGTFFFKNMVVYDILQRTSTGIEGNYGDALRYVRLILLDSGWCSCTLLCLMLVVAAVIRKLRSRRVPDLAPLLPPDGDEDEASAARYHMLPDYAWLLVIWAVIPFVLYEFPSTKYVWYIYPMLPPLYMGAAIMVSLLAGKVRDGLAEGRRARAVAGALVLCVFGGLWARGVYQVANVVVNNTYPAFWRIYTDEQKSYRADLQVALKEAFTEHGVPKGLDTYFEDEGGSNLERGETTKGFSQGSVAVAEWYGDVRPCSGGIVSFLQNTNEALLILPEEMYQSNADRLSSAEVAWDSGTYVFLVHGSS